MSGSSFSSSIISLLSSNASHFTIKPGFLPLREGWKRHGRESAEQGENRYFMVLGVSVWDRHGSDWSRIARPGQESIFRDSGGVGDGETQVELIENRQTRTRIGILRFRGCQHGIDMGRTGRESPDRGENRYSAIQRVSAWDRHGSDRSRIDRPGRESIFSDTGCVSVGKTQVELSENRQTRVRIGIRRFRGCQCGKDTGKTVRESPDQG